MRTIHIRDRSVLLEDVLDSVAETELQAPHQPEGSPVVYVVVNERALGPVPARIWEVVQARLDARDSAATFTEWTTGTGPVPRPPDHADDRRSPDDDVPLPPMRPATGTRRRKRPVRVLIAEQQPDLRSRLMIGLSARGFDSVAVGDGQQALHELSAHPPDVLIADLDLPRVTGDGLLLRARSGDRPVAMTILLSTALPQRMLPPCSSADVVLGRPFGSATVVEIVCARWCPSDSDDAAEAG